MRYRVTEILNSSVAILVLAYRFHSTAIIMRIVGMAQTSFTAVHYHVLVVIIILPR